MGLGPWRVGFPRFFYGKMIFFKALAGNFREFLVQKGLAIREFFEVPGLKSTEFPIEMVVSKVFYFYGEMIQFDENILQMGGEKPSTRYKNLVEPVFSDVGATHRCLEVGSHQLVTGRFAETIGTVLTWSLGRGANLKTKGDDVWNFLAKSCHSTSRKNQQTNALRSVYRHCCFFSEGGGFEKNEVKAL